MNLAISLHAATDEKRSALMPVNNAYPLAELLKACRAHAERTGRRVTFEYTLIAGENDSAEDADRLAALLRGMLSHVNVIPLNKVKEKAYTGATREAARAFAERLERKGHRTPRARQRHRRRLRPAPKEEPKRTERVRKQQRRSGTTPSKRSGSSAAGS